MSYGFPAAVSPVGIRISTVYLSPLELERLLIPHTVQAALRKADVKVYGGPHAAKKIGLTPAVEPKHEYGSKEVTLEIVDSMEQAIDHIHSFGSGHTEAIVTGVILPSY